MSSVLVKKIIKPKCKKKNENEFGIIISNVCDFTFSKMPDLNNNEPLNRSISAVVNYADASVNVMSLVWLRSVLT